MCRRPNLPLLLVALIVAVAAHGVVMYAVYSACGVHKAAAEATRAAPASPEAIAAVLAARKHRPGQTRDTAIHGGGGRKLAGVAGGGTDTPSDEPAQLPRDWRGECVPARHGGSSSASVLARDADVVVVIPAARRKAPTTIYTGAFKGTATTLGGLHLVMYEDADVDGGDLGQDAQASVPTLARACATRGAACGGFTSRGWFKAVPEGATVTRSIGTYLLVRQSAVPRLAFSRTDGGKPLHEDANDRKVNYVVDAAASFVSEVGGCAPTAPGMRAGHVQALVFNNERGVLAKRRFRSFHAAAAAHSRHSCVQFIDGFGRWVGVDNPAPGRRGLDGKRLGVRRASRLKQGEDIISNLQVAIANTDHAHILLWEDDCTFCPGTLQAFSSALDVVATVDPGFGVLKVGNGGSGVLINRRHVHHLLAYLKVFYLKENIDVLLWNFVRDFHKSDYLSRRTWSAHQGRLSTFKGYRWERVHCGSPLDYWWGSYSDQCGARLSQLDETWRCSLGSQSRPTT